MANINITIRMDEGLKKQADELFSELGLNFTTAVTLFTKQSVREQGIPFDITKHIPNKDTVLALKELEEMRSNKEEYKRYDSLEDIIKEINSK